VPVKWWESRSESHQSTSHGRAHTETIEVAVKNDGTILGMKVDTLGNVGAYLSNMASGGPTVNPVNFGTGNYKIANYEATSHVVVTNTVPVDAYRGSGRPEGAYIAERAIDAVARHLNIDQVEIRRKNSFSAPIFPIVPMAAWARSMTAATMTACSRRRLPPSTMKRAAMSARPCGARASIAASGSPPTPIVRHGAVAEARHERL
jgi:CO/xanthine dehydrogenase Mo-binding subunit